MKKFPRISGGTFTDILKWIEEVTGISQENQKDYDGLKNTMILGRNRTLLNNRAIPSASNDVVATDAEGDVMHNGSAIYILVDNAGTLEWRSAALSSF